MRNPSFLRNIPPTTAPRIEFHHVRSYSQFYDVLSSREVIRFRVLERSKFVLFDSDWFSTPWELAPAARDAIFAYCEGRASQWGCGRACLIIHARPESAEELQRFLARILSDPASWLWLRRVSGCIRSVPLDVLEAAA